MGKREKSQRPSPKRDGLWARLSRLGSKTVGGGMSGYCWACSLGKCGQMHDNYCPCCRRH